MKTSAQIRKMWLDFFASKGHMIEPGASLIPNNDPTLLWINSGVAALKKYFDGTEKPKNKRIVNAQKSVRTNDIDNVGYTSRHHTFFEMLGNFSIGDYFRDEAIVWAYEFLTSPKWLGFDLKNIYITYHPDDLATYNKWLSLGIDKNKLVICEGNFWEIGPGPCGPNTEIFIDRGEKYDPQGLGERLIREDLENDRYIEIWNIVFSQFNAEPGVERSKYKELPQKNIDTGAGFERLVSILQNGETNFDTDLFLPIINKIEKLAKFPYQNEYKICYRVIADHIRATSFALCDGALFANEGRGYVLRRILRRAIRYGKKLGIEGTFMHSLVPIVGEIMQSYYPEVLLKCEYIQKLIKLEEEKFQTTLNAGEQLLKDYIEKSDEKLISGELAFKLYDTYGFPYELTLEIANESSFKVDRVGFEEEMKNQKERARAARSKNSSMNVQSEDLMNFNLPSEFIYTPTIFNSKIIGLFKNGKAVDELENDGQIILEKTNFYAESGGQVADTGVLIIDGEEINVLDVVKAPNKQHLHYVEIPENLIIKKGQIVQVKIDIIRRNKITRAHSSAHLLQAALKEVLGDHIMQAGSYVADGIVRFDFTHFTKVTSLQLKQIEDHVNQKIDEAIPCHIEELSLEEAKKAKATALFNEKYGEKVRVVTFGNYSKELCGGCHVQNSEDIGLFIISSEESISSGVRRIEGRVGLKGYYEANERFDILNDITNKLGILSIYECKDKLANVLQQINDYKKEIQELKSKISLNETKELLSKSEDINGIKSLITTLNNYDKESIIMIVDNIKSKGVQYFIFIANLTNQGIQFICAASSEVVKLGNHCGNLVKEAALICGGQGGGRPDMAQAGGKDVDKLPNALSKIKGLIKLS